MKSHRPPSEGAPPQTVFADDGAHGSSKHHDSVGSSRDAEATPPLSRQGWAHLLVSKGAKYA
jgi:hypothetical protein